MLKEAGFKSTKTYSKNAELAKRNKRNVKRTRASAQLRRNALITRLNESIFDSEDSLRDDYWMDPFDKIAQGKT